MVGTTKYPCAVRLVNINQMVKVNAIVRPCSSHTAKTDLFKSTPQNSQDRFYYSSEFDSDLHWGSIQIVQNQNPERNICKSVYFIPYNDFDYPDKAAKIEVTM